MTDEELKKKCSEISGTPFDYYKAGYEQALKEWKSCFLSCSSPYCAGHFRDVKCEGELGNMTKAE